MESLLVDTQNLQNILQNSMVKLSLILILLALLLVFMSRSMSCPPNTVEYRYLPRTLDHYLEDIATSEELYDKVFDGEDIWYRSITKQKMKDNTVYQKMDLL